MAMGLSPDMTCPPEKLPRDFVRGGGWKIDLETGCKLLQPDFSQSWTKNATWHEGIIQFVREKATEAVKTIPATQMEGTSRNAIATQLKTVFKGIVGKYREWEKEMEAKKAGVVVVQLPHNEQREVLNRRRTRKDRVS